MRIIWVLMGLPAAGKSFWSSEEMRKYPSRYKRVNKDLLRAMLDYSVHTGENEGFVDDIRDHAVELALVKGYDVIVDDTNFNEKHYLAICDIARRIGDVHVMEKFFSIPLKEALARNAARPNPIPEDAIINMHDRYIAHKMVSVKDEYFPPAQHEYRRQIATAKEKCVIVDVDGTLAHKSPDRGFYDYDKVDQDTLNEDVAALVRDLSERFAIVIVSGRDEICYEVTKLWLDVHSIPYKQIYMRKNGDSRKDAIIKKEIYDTYIDPHYHAVYAVDDRISICTLWRSLGICCLQVAKCLA